MKRLLILATLCMFFAFSAEAQQAAKDSTAVKKEKIEGFWPVMGYLGGKLVDELSDRLNLEEEEKQSKGTPTEVEVRLGWIKFTRVEER